MIIPVILISLAQFKWFDWWGGYTYGYRPLLDVIGFLVLLQVPVLNQIWGRIWLKRTYLALLFLSIFIQAVGAISYDMYGWNQRFLHVVQTGENSFKTFLTKEEVQKFRPVGEARYLGMQLCNIDILECRHRLWSITDSEIPYYLTHFFESIENRRREFYRF